MTDKKIEITEEMLAFLREKVSEYQTGKRYNHTLAVEKKARELSALFLPEEADRLCAAALLHDITKVYDTEKQLKTLREFGIIIRAEDRAAPKLLHARTGECVARRDFSLYTDSDILSAIRWHTTGRAGMSLFEALIYLADYIEDTRDFSDCVKLREMFEDGIKSAETAEERSEVLRKVMITSFDMTVRCLVEEGALVDRDTIEARNWFILNKKCFG